MWDAPHPHKEYLGMKLSVVQFGLFAAGVMLAVAALIPQGVQQSYAAPLAALTETTEPPSPPPRPSDTPVPPEQPPTTPPEQPPTSTTPSERPGTDRNTDPQITKTAGTGAVNVGDIVTFRLTVRNQGDAPGRDVEVEDSLPSFLQLVNATTEGGTLTTSGNTVRVSLGTLEPWATVNITIEARVLALPVPPPACANVATLTTSSPSDDPSNNSACAPLTFQNPTVTPTVSPTISPTLLATVSPSVVATLAPTQIPVTLPRTGDSGGWGGGNLLLALLGVALLVSSFFVRRRPAA